MKLFARKFGIAAALLLVFAIGCVAGLLGASWLYYRHVFSRQVDRTAVDLTMQVNTASQLRLGEVNGVINDLETRIDMGIVSVGLTPHIPITDYRRRVLRGAKTYREIYPSKSTIASRVAEALEKVAKIEMEEFKCESALWRLVKDNAPQSAQEGDK